MRKERSKFAKSLTSMALALILTLGVGGFTAFAGEVGNASGGYFGTNDVDRLYSGGGGSSEPPRRPCVCGGGDGINLSPICGNG